jgi:uncharacterized PurR-regulated membrane protein YhhQ (DUF165 family)
LVCFWGYVLVIFFLTTEITEGTEVYGARILKLIVVLSVSVNSVFSVVYPMVFVEWRGCLPAHRDERVRMVIF